MRKADNDVLLVVANFDSARVNINVTIPSHAFDFLGLSEQTVEMTDLLSGIQSRLRYGAMAGSSGC